MTAKTDPYRGQRFGMKLLRDLWEVRYDPYDASCVWVRNHHDGGWITAYWRQLNATRQPFGEDIWERGRQIAAGRGTASPSEQEITQAVDQLLDKASPSPGKRRPGQAKTRRIVARNAAATAARRSRPTDSAGPDPEPNDHVLKAETEPRETAGHLAKVIPLKVYNPQERADEWW